MKSTPIPFSENRHARNQLAAGLLLAALIGATIAVWGQSAADVLSTVF